MYTTWLFLLGKSPVLSCFKNLNRRTAPKQRKDIRPFFRHNFKIAAHLLIFLVPLIMISLNAEVTAADQENDPNPWKLPAEFLIGTAISGFQAEMGCPHFPESLCDDTNSDWYAYATSDLFPPDPFMLSEQNPSEAGPGLSCLWPEQQFPSDEH